MRRLFLTTLLVALAAPAAAQAATPFQIGNGFEPALTVDAAGTAHVAWSLPGGSGVGYCQVPRGSLGCAPGKQAKIGADDVSELNIFVAPGRIEIYGAQGNTTGCTFEIQRYVSTDNGASFSGSCKSSIDSPIITRGENVLDATGRFLGASISDSGELARFLALPSGTLAAPDAGSAQIFPPRFPNYRGMAVAKAGAGAQGRLVAVASTQENVPGTYFSIFPANPDEGTATANLNNAVKWTKKDIRIPGSENGDILSLPTMSGGAAGIILARGTSATDNAIEVRRFDPATDSFSAPVVVDGNPAIDTNIFSPSITQNGPGTVHLVWFADGRLRYARSTDAGRSFALEGTVTDGLNVLSDLDVATAPDSQGFASFDDGGTPAAAKVFVVPLVATPDAPPATNPPVTNPPVTNPPVSNPPVAAPPRPVATVKTTTVTASGAKLSLGTPRACVPAGGTFVVTLKFAKVKKKGNIFIKVFRVDFSGTGIKRTIDKRAPFRKTLRVKVGTRKGAKVSVRARAFMKVSRGKSPTKSIRASVTVCA